MHKYIYIYICKDQKFCAGVSLQLLCTYAYWYIYYIQYVCLNIHQKFSFITCASSTRKINCTCILRTGDGVHQHFDAVTNRFTEQHLGIGPVIVWISCGFNKIWVWKYNVVFTRGAFSIFAISGSSIAIEWMRTF